VFPAAVAFLDRPNRGRAWLLAGVGLASGLSAWTGVLFALLTSGLLCLPGVAGPENAPGRRRQAAALLTAGVVVALMVLLAAFAWQKGGVVALVSDLGSAFRIHAERAGFTHREWLARQCRHGWMNYGPLGLPLLAVGVGLVVTWFSRRARGLRGPAAMAEPHALLCGCIAVSLATGFIWTLVFREGSYVHEYWSLPLSMGIAAVIPLLVVRVAPRHRAVASLCGAAVVVATYAMSWQAFGHRLALWRAENTGPDIAFLQSQRDERFTEFAFLPLGSHPFDSWFQTRLFEFYTARPLRWHEPGRPLTPDDRLILLTYDDQAAAEAFVERRLGVRLRNRGHGPRFCVYEVLEVQAGDAAGDPSAGQGAAEAGSITRLRPSSARRF
jgi:hypothetical protein